MKITTSATQIRKDIARYILFSFIYTPSAFFICCIVVLLINNPISEHLYSLFHYLWGLLHEAKEGTINIPICMDLITESSHKVTGALTDNTSCQKQEIRSIDLNLAVTIVSNYIIGLYFGLSFIGTLLYGINAIRKKMNIFQINNKQI